MLKKKYPKSTPDQLKEALAYAYGGAVAPDMGYYPFGSKLFTNLVHYVRSGDFVNNLIDEASDVNELAFALGALCHYNADKYGHSLGVNKSVPLVYPRQKKKFGNVVTYAEDKTSHIRVEFAFDVIQTARGNYASNSYHSFIGFKVSKYLIERTFQKTYGLQIDQLFGNFDRAISTFRFAVKDFFPEITRAAWASKKKAIKEMTPTATSKKFRFRMQSANYYKEYGKDYKKPGFFARILALVIKIFPKVGPIKALKFKPPGPTAEKLFIQSFDSVVAHYVTDIHLMDNGTLSLNNIDFDTGKPTEQGEYPLTDEAYSDWLIKLKEKKFACISPSMKKNIVEFYKNKAPETGSKKMVAKWNRTMEALKEIEILKPNSEN